MDQGPEQAVSLVARIQAGDAEAETALVERYGRGIRLILRGQLGNSHLVDDAWQETFKTAIVKIRDDELRNPAGLNAFLVSTAKFTAIGLIRKEKRHKGESNDEHEPMDATLPDTPLDRAQHARAVRDTLSSLPTRRDREILCRLYLSEEDREVICSDMELTPDHFNRVLHRAKQRYRKLLTDMGFAPRSKKS